MKNLFIALFVSIVFIMGGCSSDQEGHSHGEGADHTHETPAQQSSKDDGDAVRIGSDAHSDEEESGHSHDKDSDHQHDDGADEDSTDHQNEGHSHDGDADHDH